ncbi:MAG: FecR domain-containing protein [Spirochaetales bacterium]|nr:FecR domain-containing protein [Spirochaetales bacterium]
MVLNRFFNKKIILSLLIIFSLIPVFAQDTGGEPAAILVYADDEYEIEVLDADGIATDAYIGMDLLEGDTIKTYNSTVELQLEPNGSILKLSESTNFRIDGFQKDINSSNDFSLIAGKLRAVAARSSTASHNYNIYTQSTVCGVRGTDFLIGDNGKLVVGEGSVEFIKMDTGESVMVETGMAADAFSEAFSAVMLTAEQIAQEFQAFSFTALDPFAVEGHTPPAAPEPEPEDEPVEEEPVVEEENTDDGGAALEPVNTGMGEEAPEGESTGDDGGLLKEQSPLDKFLEPLGEFLGMEIGSMTIDGVTYSKMLLQPEFSIGDLQMSLYLPIIYQNDIFDPIDDWYHPAGNDEWSFGTDQGDDIGAIASDVLSDLFLKIKYVKWGQHRDPFYFKLGNVADMTIGHGILMENYANDADFPSIRKIGLNMGINREKMGVEFVGDNLADLSIVGGRIAFGKKLKFGISSVIDINADASAPAETTIEDPLNAGTNLAFEDSLFINLALDLDFPIIETDLLSFVLFADAATMVPVIDGQPQVNFFLDLNIEDDNFLNKLRNYGFAGGLLGNILGAQYKVQYMYSTDLFRHGLYNSTYDRTKTDYLEEVVGYLSAKKDIDTTTKGAFYSSTDYAYYEPLKNQGVYGALSWDILKMVDVTGGYKWPWNNSGELDFENDYLHFSVTLQPDVIPVVGIHGSLTYDRTGFVGSMLDADDNLDFGQFSFVDENTVLKGEIIVPVAPTLDMAATLASSLERDSDGNVVYDEDGRTNPYYAFTIDTRIHF